MKKVCVVMVFLWVSGVALGQDPGFHVVGIGSVSVPVSGLKMTNLIFPFAVSSAVKVSKDVEMQRPKGVSNVIELKALRRNFSVTNLSVYGRDGRPYSFVLHFVDDSSVLNFQVVGDAPGLGGSLPLDHPIMLSGLPVAGTVLDSDAVVLSARRGFLRHSVSSGGLRLSLRGAYLRDSLLWLCLGLRNKVQIGFTPAYLRVYVEDKAQLKRMASQQAGLLPVYSSALPLVPGRGRRYVALGLTPLVVPSGKRLVVEMSDASGGRVLVLAVKGKVLLKARKVP